MGKFSLGDDKIHRLQKFIYTNYHNGLLAKLQQLSLMAEPVFSMTVRQKMAFAAANFVYKMRLLSLILYSKGKFVFVTQKFTFCCCFMFVEMV